MTYRRSRASGPQDTFTQRHGDTMPRSFLVKKYFAKQKPNYSELECQNGEFLLLFLIWVMKASLRKSASERKPPVFLNAVEIPPPPSSPLVLFNFSDDSFQTLFSKHQRRCSVCVLEATSNRRADGSSFKSGPVRCTFPPFCNHTELHSCSKPS